MPHSQNQESWESLRLSAVLNGWEPVLRKEAIRHFVHLRVQNDTSHYQTLHIFFNDIATPDEQQQMLAAGYRPLS